MDRDPLPSKKTRASGIALSYVEVSGPPPALLLLHGATDSLTGYGGALTMLMGERRLVALDLRGHGESDHVPGAYRVVDHVADVRAVVETVIAQPTVIAGHSLGALVAIGVGGLGHPLVRGLYLEDPPFYSARLPTLRQRPEYQTFAALRAVLDHHHTSRASVEVAQLVGSWPLHPRLYEGRSLLDVAGPEIVRARAESLHRLDLGVLDAILDGSQLAGLDLDATAPALRIPVHLLAGDPEYGGALDADDVARLAAALPRGTHRRLTGVGHFVHHTDPATYVAELRAFVSCC